MRQCLIPATTASAGRPAIKAGQASVESYTNDQARSKIYRGKTDFLRSTALFTKIFGSPTSGTMRQCLIPATTASAGRPAIKAG
ncbi:MAG: hypothetical protein L6420_01060, partial [Elusimicrobia bacterium]|nr:hypothetical protein [Elusimicrobiota bacterium]